MALKKVSCSSCGATQLKELPNGMYRCEYCGTTYSMDSINFDSNENLEDATVSANMSAGRVFAVHKKLVVSGNMNSVKLKKTGDNAIHVSSLTISGNMNVVKVILLDGATYVDIGNMNTIK